MKVLKWFVFSRNFNAKKNIEQKIHKKQENIVTELRSHITRYEQELREAKVRDVKRFL